MTYEEIVNKKLQNPYQSGFGFVIISVFAINSI